MNLKRNALSIATGICIGMLSLPPAIAQTPQEARLLETEGRLAEKAEAAETARRQREEAEEKRRETQKEAAERKRERERQCVIRPVMSDAEIATCKEVWR